jgi:hypothetical protein
MIPTTSAEARDRRYSIADTFGKTVKTLKDALSPMTAGFGAAADAVTAVPRMFGIPVGLDSPDASTTPAAPAAAPKPAFNPVVEQGQPTMAEFIAQFAGTGNAGPKAENLSGLRTIIEKRLKDDRKPSAGEVEAKREREQALTDIGSAGRQLETDTSEDALDAIRQKSMRGREVAQSPYFREIEARLTERGARQKKLEDKQPYQLALTMGASLLASKDPYFSRSIGKAGMETIEQHQKFQEKNTDAAQKLEDARMLQSKAQMDAKMGNQDAADAKASAAFTMKQSAYQSKIAGLRILASESGKAERAELERAVSNAKTDAQLLNVINQQESKLAAAAASMQSAALRNTIAIMGLFGKLNPTEKPTAVGLKISQSADEIMNNLSSPQAMAALKAAGAPAQALADIREGRAKPGNAIYDEIMTKFGSKAREAIKNKLYEDATPKRRGAGTIPATELEAD